MSVLDGETGVSSPAAGARAGGGRAALVSAVFTGAVILAVSLTVGQVAAAGGTPVVPLAPTRAATTTSGVAPSPFTRASPISSNVHTVTTVPPLVTRVGDFRVEMGRRVRLVLNVANREALWRHAQHLTYAIASGLPTPTTTVCTETISIQLHWADPMGQTLVLPVHDGAVDILIPAGRPRTIGYYFTWRPTNGAFELAVPGPPLEFHAQVIARQASLVLEGTGSHIGAMLGGQIPIKLEIRDPHGVTSATLSYRSREETRFSTAALALTAGDDHEGRWEVRIARPPGVRTAIEYFIEIRNKSGDRSTYGSASVPYCIQLLDPTSER